MTKFLTQEALRIIQNSRLQDLLCYDCTYEFAGGMSGQAITDYICKKCERAMSYSNTGTPNYCKGCAYELFSCQRCMQSLKKDIE